MYMTKNYSADGGDKLVVTGSLEFGEGAKIEGFPLEAENVSDATGTAAQKISAILLAMKKAGLMVGDAMSITLPSGITYSGMATDETAANSNKVTTTLEDGVITVAVGGKIEDELEEADHGSTWGKHYWLGFGIRTGFASDAGVKFTQLSGNEGDPTVVTLTTADDDEAHSVGLASAGDIILYIKAEVVRANGLEFSLGKDGYETETFKIVIDETEGD